MVCTVSCTQCTCIIILTNVLKLFTFTSMEKVFIVWMASKSRLPTHNRLQLKCIEWQPLYRHTLCICKVIICKEEIVVSNAWKQIYCYFIRAWERGFGWNGALWILSNTNRQTTLVKQNLPSASLPCLILLYLIFGTDWEIRWKVLPSSFRSLFILVFILLHIVSESVVVIISKVKCTYV